MALVRATFQLSFSSLLAWVLAVYPWDVNLGVTSGTPACGPDSSTRSILPSFPRSGSCGEREREVEVAGSQTL